MIALPADFRCTAAFRVKLQAFIANGEGRRQITSVHILIYKIYDIVVLRIGVLQREAGHITPFPASQTTELHCCTAV